jgi:hypothetical protein
MPRRLLRVQSVVLEVAVAVLLLGLAVLVALERM